MHRQSNILHFSGPVLLLRNLTHIQPLSVRAASAAEWRQFFVTSVESVYIRENLSRFEVVTFKCFYSDCHRGEQKMAGHWTQPQLRPMLYPQRSRDDSERQSRIRPMPTVSITGMFVLCDPRRGKCRGDNCTFAHSIEERDAWNAQRRDREIGKPVSDSIFKCPVKTLFCLFYLRAKYKKWQWHCISTETQCH